MKTYLQKSLHFLLAISITASSLAQNPAAPQAQTRDADIVWSKKLWRILDVREKLNLPLYYPLRAYDNFKALFDVLRDAVMKGELTAYGDPGFDDSFTNSYTISEIGAKLVRWDSTHIGLDVMGEEKVVPLRTEISAENVKQYLIKEDWFFDKQKSSLQNRIIGICPMVESFTESGELRGYVPLFWIYFPDARAILANHPAFNSMNPGASLSFDDLFIKRMFSSVIIKESNVYDRYIADYRQGLDALLEAKDIEEKMFNWEDGVWHY